MLTALVGEVMVTPGMGVTAPGVCRGAVGVLRNNVGVVVIGRGVDVAGEAQLATRTNPMNKGKIVLVFILISSLNYYIPRQKENATYYLCIVLHKIK
jgi:hypothetical protein